MVKNYALKRLAEAEKLRNFVLVICLEQHIAFLVSRHDCVIVPGFGAFISTYEPAVCDFETLTVTPPSRRLSFNAGVTHNDGMLASSVARREGIPYERAADRVNSLVDEMKVLLETNGSIEIEGVGRFTAGIGGSTPVFEPAHDCVADMPYMFMPHVRVAAAEAPVKSPAPEPYRRGITLKAARAVVGVAVSFALLLGLGFTLTMPQGHPGCVNDYASLVATPRVPVTARTVVGDDVLAGGELFIAIPGDDDASVTVDTAAHSAYRILSVGKMAEKTSTRRVSVGVSPDREDTGFCVVVASLETRSRAEKFITQSGDSSLRIMKSGPGRYRVYAAEASTFDSAMAARNSGISRRYPDAWVCAR